MMMRLSLFISILCVLVCTIRCQDQRQLGYTGSLKSGGIKAADYGQEGQQSTGYYQQYGLQRPASQQSMDYYQPYFSQQRPVSQQSMVYYQPNFSQQRPVSQQRTNYYEEYGARRPVSQQSMDYYQPYFSQQRPVSQQRTHYYEEFGAPRPVNQHRTNYEDFIAPRLGPYPIENQYRYFQGERNQYQHNSLGSIFRCQCVPFYYCNVTNTKENNDIRIRHEECDSYFDVCCKKEDQLKVRSIPLPIPGRRPVCGVRHPEGVRFKVIDNKENETQYGEFPWMIGVFKEKTFDYLCGGALIHPQMIITAAHCVNGINETLMIRAGDWYADDTNEPYEHQDREVGDIVIHQDYSTDAKYQNVYNDIALLYLKSPLEIADNIDTICLPPQGTVINSSACYETGWGLDENNQRFQGILKKNDIPIVPVSECQEKFKNLFGASFELHKSDMCAGGVPGKHTCKGDGGSPLVCQIPGKKDRYYQAGISAWGLGCNYDSVPGVYVKLPLFRDWIDSKMKLFKLDTSSYEY